jgi:hypothetical protein
METEIKQDQLPDPLFDFQPVEAQALKNPNDNYLENISQHDLDVLELEEADLRWKLQARKIFSGIFTGILVLQNTGVAWLLYTAYRQGQLEGLAVISSGLVVGTLAETAFIVRIMVQWIFSDSRYEVRRK